MNPNWRPTLPISKFLWRVLRPFADFGDAVLVGWTHFNLMRKINRKIRKLERERVQ